MTWSNDPARNRAFDQGETAKIRWEVLPWTQGDGLDLGCGPFKLWPTSIGVDRPARGSKANLGGDVTKLKLIATESVDYVFSSHCLEDIEDTIGTLAEWWRVLKVGGHLVLYLPHRDYYPNIGEEGGNAAHKHDFLPEDIVNAMKAAAPDWALRENQERDCQDEYSFLQVYTKRPPGTGQGARLEESDPAKRCIAVRYGGFGDVLMAASTFPLLKEQGWHLTVYAGVKGAEVLRFDPHIDRLIVHDILGTTDRELTNLWRYLRTRCAKFVNFSQTVENLLLADPRRQNFYWPQEMRHRYMNTNYLEAMHEVACVSAVYRQRFYPTDAERIWAADWWKKADGSFRVVVAATGSGVNKIWPGLFEYVGRLAMRHEKVNVVVLGGLHSAKLLEHERIHELGETLSIRRSLALALQADLVIGQETGILNAVAHEPMPKIVLLSHSSEENLTKNWVNTEVLIGQVPCYPCHRLHSDWSGCNQDPLTKFAACQSAIEPMAAVELTERMLGIEVATT